MKAYRIKPLEWTEIRDDRGVRYTVNAAPYGSYKVFESCKGIYTAGLYHGFCCSENIGIVKGLEAAKQLAEQHWRRTLAQVLEEVE